MFSVLCNGDRRLDVETTNKEGFDPDATGRAKVAKATGKAVVKERHAGHRREVGEAGLAAIIAYNHGVTLAKAKKYYEAILANVRALALDRDNPAAACNAIADLTNWPAELSKDGKYANWRWRCWPSGTRWSATARTRRAGCCGTNTVAVYDAWARGA